MSLANEICRMDAITLAAQVRAKSLSASEVTEAVLARMEVLEPQLHAFCTPTPDVARAAARAVDARIAAGQDPGPLAGVPVGIKDLLATAGIRTAMGSPLYENFVPEEDDIVVERLKAAGAIIIGKTSVPEFGYSGVSNNPLFPATRNPWDLAMTPGGSSSGSGAAVAAGLGPIAIGSDGGGSVRVPAAHCGLVGFQGVDGAGAFVPRLSRSTVSRPVELGIAGTHRPDDTHRGRCGPDDERDCRPRCARSSFHPGGGF